MQKNKILKVWIEKKIDNYPDTSFIGEYTDKADDWNICRHCGEFVAIAEIPNRRAEEIENEIYELENDWRENSEIDGIKDSLLIHKINILNFELNNLDLHDCPHSSREYNYFKPYAGGEKPGSDLYIQYGKQDFDRMESLNNGNWCFIGIVAYAEIVTKSGTIQTIQSGGLWGIESDSDESYIQDVINQELDNLKAELKELGFVKKNEIDKAVEGYEVEE